MRYICAMAMRMLAPLLLLLTVLLAPDSAALAAPHHQAAGSVPAAEDCPSHAGPQHQEQQQSEHRSCCSVGCSTSAVLGLPPAPAVPHLGGRHALPLPAAQPPARPTDTLFRPPR